MTSISRARRGRVLPLAALCCVGLLPGPARAQQDDVDARAPLIGRVVDRHGAPLPGICLSATAVRGNEENYRTVSGKHGRFILDTTSHEYPTRGYEIVLTLCGTTRNVSPEWYLHADYYEAQSWVIVHAGHTTHQDFVLRTGAAVTGVVTGIDGRPLVGGCVWTREWGEPEGVTYTDQRVAYTDAQGRYRMTQLVPGKHRFAAYQQCGDRYPIAVSGRWTAWPNGDPVTIAEGESATVDMSFGPRTAAP